MSETPATIYRWMNETFPGTDPESPRKVIRALEEMVELCLAAGATPSEIADGVRKVIHKERPTSLGEQGWHDSRPDKDKIPGETADVVIVLCGVAGMRGFDLQAEVDKKMAINRGRRWKANGDGTGYHCRDEENPEKQGVS